MKTLKPKTIIIFLTALVAIVSFWLYLNRYLYKPKAAAEKINVTFAPTSGNFKVDERKTLDVIIQTAGSNKKISGLDLVFTASGNLSILGLTPPAPYPQSEESKLNQTQVLSEISEKQARLVYVFSSPDEQLPSALILKMDFQGTSQGSGTIKLETNKSQVVGNVFGNLYELGKVKTARFNFSGISPLPTLPPTLPPVISITAVPTNCLCLNDLCDASCQFKEPKNISYKCSLSSSLFPTAPSVENKNAWCRRPYRTLGDADGNGTVEKLDYYYYVGAVNGGKIPVSVNPDFNGDGEVGVADREIVVKSL